MKKYYLVSWILLLIAAISFLSCQSTKSSTASKMMKFNFENGKGYDYDMRIAMDQAMGPLSTKMGMNAYYSMAVTGEDSTGKTISVVYDSFGMEMDIMGKHIELGTDAKPLDLGSDEDNEKGAAASKAMNRLFRAIKGMKFDLKVNHEGKVLEVRGLEEMLNTIVDSLTVDDEDKKQQFKELAEKQFNSDDIRQQFEQAFFIFPNKEVKVGDSWEKDFITSGMMKSQLHTIYKVKEIEGDMVTLSIKGTIEASQETIMLTGNQEGEMVVDSRSGLIVTSDIDQVLKTTVEKMPISVNVNSKIRGKAK